MAQSAQVYIVYNMRKVHIFAWEKLHKLARLVGALVTSTYHKQTLHFGYEMIKILSTSIMWYWPGNTHEG
jgi:hypothetical protein